MPRLLLLLIFWFSFPRANAQTPTPSPATIAQRPDNVGDIAFDPALDDPSFHLHDSTRVWQYYNSAAYWLDHKDSVTRFIRSRYHPPANATKKANGPNATTAANQDGWLTIRFIINTEGRTGRFRLSEMDSAYQPTHFDPRISDQLLAAVKDWPGWRPAHYKEMRFDTYQYITFRLRQGRIITISP
jgi:hypothetical protein